MVVSVTDDLRWRTPASTTFYLFSFVESLPQCCINLLDIPSPESPDMFAESVKIWAGLGGVWDVTRKRWDHLQYLRSSRPVLTDHIITLISNIFSHPATTLASNNYFNNISRHSEHFIMAALVLIFITLWRGFNLSGNFSARGGWQQNVLIPSGE